LAHLSASEQSYQLSRNPFLMTMSTFSLAMASKLQGDIANAKRYFTECLDFFIQTKNRQFEAMVRSELAHLARQSGDTALALEGYRDTIRRWRELGQRGAIANQLECFAFLARQGGDTGQALRLLGAAQALREAIEAPMADYEVSEYEQEVALLRLQVDPQVFEAGWKAGRLMTMEQAVDYALEMSRVVEKV
jgi:tetratricopeptide (TPR) repeat protein